MATILFDTAQLTLFVFLCATLFAITTMWIPSFSWFPISKKLRTVFNFIATRTLFMGVTSITHAMVFGMFRVVFDKLKIDKHIVAWIPINVMNYFLSFKLPFKMLFHNMTVLKHPFTIHLDTAISIFSCAPSFIPRMIMATKCKVSAVARTKSLFSPVKFKFFTTSFTKMLHNITNGSNGLKGYLLMPVTHGGVYYSYNK